MIKRIIYWILFFLFCFILQTTLVKIISVYGVRPDLILVALFIFCTKTGVLPGVYLGFFLGLLQDLYSPSILGQNALSKSVIGFLAGHFNDKVIKLDPVLKAVLLIVLFMVNDSLIMIIEAMKLGTGMDIIGPELLRFTLPRAFYSLLFAALPFIWDAVIQPAFRRY
ncbi:Rod shape-determining protein MreD [Chitinispirillum alkaliphilum]|nr:Rod shape-determining protein MreD [Chitinispirillum alkaliphilum]